jgi:P-type Cu2+ transporter
MATKSSRDRETAASLVHQPCTCAHCTLPVPAGLIDTAASQQFCCEGCRSAYEVIHGCGLDRYYALREQARADTAPVQRTGRRYSEYDDATFHSLYATQVEPGILRCELFLQNVHCAACVWLVERLPQLIKGVLSATLDFRRATLTVTWDTRIAQLSHVAHVLETLGYPPHPARGVKARQLRQVEDRKSLMELAIAGAIASNVMLIFVALYAGLFDTMDQGHVQMFRWVSMGLSVISLLWPGRVFLRSALAALRMRTLHLDIPIAAGLAAGVAWGVINTIRGVGDIYFDSIAVLIFFLLVGRFIQRRQQRAAADSVELLFTLTPSVARKVSDDNTVRDVPIETIREHDIVEVRTGDCVPVDGVIVTGLSTIDKSLLTGESRPVSIETGDIVHAGTVNLSGILRVKVHGTGEATRVGRLMRLVEEGARSRAPIIQLTDRLAGAFIAVMLVVGAFTVALWWHIDPTKAIENAVALLVVTCPCGLGLATPLVMTMAMGRAAREGVLIKNAEVIQRLANPGEIILDKTGTLTHGATRLVKWWGDARVLPMIVAIERESSHHVARAVAQGLASQFDEHEIPDASHVREVTGKGIEGFVSAHHVRLCSSASITSRAGEGVKFAEGMQDARAAAIAMGLSPVLVEVDGFIVAVLGLGDQLRDESPALVASLRTQGWRVRVLSGDEQSIVQRVGASLGLSHRDATGAATPEEKLAAVRDSAQRMGDRHTTVMVGDGVNDAPALAAAHVGIAVKGGAEASLAAADIFLARGGLRDVTHLLDGSRRTMRAIHLCIIASVAYNIIAAALCITGLITPLLAAIIMPMASLSVLAIAVRAQTFGVKSSSQASTQGAAS